jgi:hypothetical protein
MLPVGEAKVDEPQLLLRVRVGLITEDDRERFDDLMCSKEARTNKKSRRS